MKAMLVVLLSALVAAALCVETHVMHHDMVPTGMGGTHRVMRQYATMNDFGSGTTMTAGGGFYRQKRQFFGNQHALNIQNNQFAAAGGRRGYGYGGRWKRQFFGNQNAGNIQNNQFGTNQQQYSGGYGNYYRQKRQFYGTQNAGNIQNNQFGNTGGYGNYYRQKRQFYGNQFAKNIQNNQFAAGGHRGHHGYGW